MSMLNIEKRTKTPVFPDYALSLCFDPTLLIHLARPVLINSSYGGKRGRPDIKQQAASLYLTLDLTTFRQYFFPFPLSKSTRTAAYLDG
jgi:hypothetical protein